MLVFDPASIREISKPESVKMTVYKDIMAQETHHRNVAIQAAKDSWIKDTNLSPEEIDKELQGIYELWPLPETTDIRLITSGKYKYTLGKELSLSQSEIFERMDAYNELWPCT